MKTPVSIHALSPLAFALLLLPLRVDDPARPQGRVNLPLPGAGAGEDDPHAEIMRLFGKIEVELRQIDRLLSDASAGGATAAEAAKKAGEAAENAIEGIDKLLDKTEQRSRSVIEQIDRIFELADHPHEPGGT